MVLFDMPAMRRYRLVMALGAACLILWAILRAVLWWRFGFRSGVSAWMLPAILAGGAVNDLVVAAYLFALLALYSALPPDRWYESKANRWLLAAGSWLTIAWLAFLAFTEFYYFQEFDARFNLVAFDYLAYPTEVAGDVWAEYPVIRIALESALFATAAIWIIRGCFRRSSAATGPLARRVRPMLLHLAVVLLCALFYSTDLLSLSSSRIIDELVQNGTSSFFLAAKTSEIEFHAYYKSADPAGNLGLIAHELARGGGRFTRLDDGRLDRAFPARAGGLGKLNVVLISSESFGAEFSRLYGSSRDLTPFFDSYAKKALWFRHTYAAGTRTVRALEALASSIPPIPTVSILRRPGNEHVATWGAVMRSLGYHTSFVFGLKRAVSYYDYDAATDRYSPASPDPEFERLGIAYFQTAYELFAPHHYEAAPAAPRDAPAAAVANQ